MLFVFVKTIISKNGKLANMIGMCLTAAKVLTVFHQEGTVFIPILQMKKLRKTGEN